MLGLGFTTSVVPHAPFQNAANTHRTRAILSAPRTVVEAIALVFPLLKTRWLLTRSSTGENHAEPGSVWAGTSGCSGGVRPISRAACTSPLSKVDAADSQTKANQHGMGGSRNGR